MSNSIRVKVLCAVHMVGVSERGRGNPYDFSQVRYLVPFSDLNTEFCVRTAAGQDVISVDTSKEVVESIKVKNFNFPLDLDLHLTANPQNLQRNICVGFSEVSISDDSSINDLKDDTKKADFSKKFGA